MALIRSSLDFHRRQQHCAYVGARLEVPNVLHADLVRGTGSNADARLQAWYSELDAELEASGEAISPDVFKWLRGRWRVWVQAEQDAAERAKFLGGGRG